jgi:hypothetical protein
MRARAWLCGPVSLKVLTWSSNEALSEKGATLSPRLKDMGQMIGGMRRRLYLHPYAVGRAVDFARRRFYTPASIRSRLERGFFVLPLARDVP